MENEGSTTSGVANEPSSVGFSILEDPDGATLDIVFVHGFTGHPVRTWTHKTEYVTHNRGDSSPNGAQRPAKKARFSAVTSLIKDKEERKYIYWPRDLIPKILPTARILVYGYDTRIRHSLGSSISKNTVYDIAFDFLQSFEAERRSHPSRPIIFVAHSLGGIVVKEALRRSYSFTSHHAYLHQIYKSTSAILFFGTPHGGADPRGLLESIAEKAFRAAGFTVNEEIVKSLLPSSERLRELRDEFSPMADHEKWIIYSFQEQYGVPYLQGKKVVEDVSSCLGDSSLEVRQHIANNHMDMCRFSGYDDVEYRKVVAALDRIQMRISEDSPGSALPGSNLVLSANDRQFYLDSLWYRTIESRHATIKRAHARTCRWLLEKTEYQDWLDANKTVDHHGFLWIRGKPGSGKSTLMKFAVENMRKESKKDIIISFFFNARGEDLDKSTLGMYRSLLHQMLQAIPDLSSIFNALGPIVQTGESYLWEEDTLQNLFAAAIGSLEQRHLTCFIDALDECDEGQMRELVAFLERLGQVAIPSQIDFHVCLSSRPYPHVSMKNGIKMTLQDQEGHAQDIEQYLSSELKVDDGEKTRAIKEEILERSSGIFLWVVLVVQILNKDNDHGRVHTLRRRLREIPDGLDKLFEDILMRDQENKEEMLLCLQLVLYARRPLKREEIYHAIMHEFAPEELSELKAEEVTTHVMERFILSCSKGLAETTKLKAQTVQFIHESVRDFLLGKNGLNKLKLDLGLGLSQDRLKQCCYKYIMTESSEYWYDRRLSEVVSNAQASNLRLLFSGRLPFLEYAVRNVLYHADLADGQDISQEDFLRHFALGQWIKLDNVFEKYEIRRHTAYASLLYILAEKNLINLVQTQLKLEAHPRYAFEQHFEHERYKTPLRAALNNAHANEDTVRALLVPNARVNGRAGHRQGLCQILVEEQLDLNRESCDALLPWAIGKGSPEVLRFLFTQKHIIRNSNYEGDQTILSEAIKEGHELIVDLILAQENVNLKRDTPYGVISLAIRCGHTGIARLLIESNFDVNVKDGRGRTPLSNAAKEGMEDVVRSLLAREETELNSKDDYDNSPLHRAINFAQRGIVRLLLEKKEVDVNIKDDDGETPLLRAAYARQRDIVSLLLERKDIDVNIEDNASRTALSRAVDYGYEDIVRLLLKRTEVKLNIKHPSGCTLLSVALQNNSSSMHRLLLTHQDINPFAKTEVE